MLHLLGLVLLIGIVDSLNPSTVAPALYIAAGRSPHRGLAGFIIGVFGVNLLAGLLLALGPGQALLAVVPKPGFEVRHVIELTAGAVIIVVAVVLWFGRRRLQPHVVGRVDRIDQSSLLVGAGITAAELPTALPYFAVIAAIVGSGHPIGTQVALLALFNVAFVAPLLVVLGLRTLLPARGQVMIESLRSHLDRRLAVAIPALVGLIGVVLTAVGAVGVAIGHPLH
jgi:hypothetical protein